MGSGVGLALAGWALFSLLCLHFPSITQECVFSFQPSTFGEWRSAKEGLAARGFAGDAPGQLLCNVPSEIQGSDVLRGAEVLALWKSYEPKSFGFWQAKEDLIWALAP